MLLCGTDENVKPHEFCFSNDTLQYVSSLHSKTGPTHNGSIERIFYSKYVLLNTSNFDIYEEKKI